MAAYKVRVQLYGDDEQLMGDADVQTTADLVYFEDGKTLQQKLESGDLKGPAGAAGQTGPIGPRGSRWNAGTAITGASTAETVFSSSGIVDAMANDMYLNTSTGDVYKCTAAGNASVAKWVYAGSIKGATGAKGDTGATGPKGATGAMGPKGDGVKVGSTYASAAEKNIFFKLL